MWKCGRPHLQWARPNSTTTCWLRWDQRDTSCRARCRRWQVESLRREAQTPPRWIPPSWPRWPPQAAACTAIDRATRRQCPAKWASRCPCQYPGSPGLGRHLAPLQSPTLRRRNCHGGPTPAHSPLPRTRSDSTPPSCFRTPHPPSLGCRLHTPHRGCHPTTRRPHLHSFLPPESTPSTFHSPTHL